jgi:signal transduction histidine kinase
VSRLLQRVKRSLFLRLVLIFLAAAVIASLLIMGGLRLIYHGELNYGLERYVRHYLSYLVTDLGTPPDPQRAKQLTQQLPLDIRLCGPELSWASHADFPPPSALDEPYHRDGDILVYHAGHQHILGITNGQYRVLLAIPGFSSHGHYQASLLIMLVILAILIAIYSAVSWLFRPLKWISEGSARIGQGDLAYRLPEHREDELGSIIRDINAMAGELQQRLEAKRQLLLAVSHELRTPLTRARLALEFLDELARPRQLIQEELDEITHLVEELLETERLSENHHLLDLRDVDLTKLTRELLHERFSSQSKRLRASLPEPPVHVFADAPRVRLLLRNLIANALQHSDTPQPVELRLVLSDTSYRFEVVDHGKGIAEEHLALLSEPFYRVDPARRRETGGFGLGLYLCRLVAEAHDGSLIIESELERGTRVIATLAIRPDAAKSNGNVNET